MSGSGLSQGEPFMSDQQTSGESEPAPAVGGAGGASTTARARSMAEDFVDRGAPWSPKTSWSIVLVEGIVVAIVGLLFIFKPLGGTSTTLQLVGFVLLGGSLVTIVQRSGRILGMKIDESGALELGRRSRGTPRIANRLLRRVRDFAQIKADGRITRPVVTLALKALEVDERGLDDMDKRILTTIIEKFSGGPVGIGKLATAVGEEGETIEEIYEPYLVQEGFLERTPRGREVTDLARKHFGRQKPTDQTRLL